MTLPTGSISGQNVDITKTPFVIFQSSREDYERISNQKTSKIDLGKFFFHEKNVEFLQKMIIARVFGKTHGSYLIERQDPKDLYVVMNAIFLQNARYQSTNIKGQISELNGLVLDAVVPGIISEIRGYEGYLERAFGPRQIMDHPENVSKAGLRSLPSRMS